MRERFLVNPVRLRRRLDPASMPFATTAEVEPLQGTVGQPRALAAIEFGLSVQNPGYNLFIAGASGSGRSSTIQDFLARFARERPLPDDWAYVHNFDHPDRPRAIRLPAGRGRTFAQDMDGFVKAARRQITRVFETEGYDQRRHELMSQVGERRDRVLEELNAFARERGFRIQTAPNGIIALPVADGRPIPPEAIERMPEAQRAQLERHGSEVQEQVAGAFRKLNQLERETVERVRELDAEVALFAVDPLLHDLRGRYADLTEVLEHLERLRADIPEHLADFRQPVDGPSSPATQLEAMLRDDHDGSYRVNAVVANGTSLGAPVVIERNPTYYNLLGRVEYRASFGTMVTDFRNIRPGALHRANGGFLVLEAEELLRNPFAWEALKRALRWREIRIENLGEQLSVVPTASLTPQPIPLDVKVVLLGSLSLYHLLHALDQDFPKLFKVKADFAPDMEWSDEHVRNYAAFVSRCVREGGLLHFDASAVARLIEYSARERDDQEKLTARLIEISDLVTEASFWASRAGHETVEGGDVGRAIAEKRYRSDLLEERIQDMIRKGTIAIEAAGARVGQVNGLSVIELGDRRFGIPSRVSSSVSVGRGTLVSIEREIELSGPIHSKGFLILSGYLAQTYGQESPLAVRATLTFEQSYEEVDGDSASSTELYALLSAISGLPLPQSVAVTGSVDQHGNVQAVGGVTAKVEGFFEVCRAAGLTGDQGVLIPASNVRHLMLDDEVVEAVRGGRFHVWAVSTIDEGIEVLFDRTAGERGPEGMFPEGSVHRLVADRLREYAERQREFSGSPEESRNGHELGPAGRRSP